MSFSEARKGHDIIPIVQF